jgi:hypothetical protein
MDKPRRSTPNSIDADNGALRWTQVQDPSALSTQQVFRENFWLRELLEMRITGIEHRIDGSDKAVGLLQAFADRAPTTMDVQHQVIQLREVAMEKFDGIRTQLSERDIQTEKASRDVKSAVDAAFAAAKEAVGEQNKSNTLAITKSEAGVKEQLALLVESMKTNAKSIDDKISDIKERITIIESKTSVSDPSTAITLAKLDATVARLSSTGDIGAGSKAGQAALWALVVGGIGLLLGVASTIAMIMKALAK